MRDNTPNAFIAMECVEQGRREDLQKALDDLAELLTTYLHAEIVASAIVTKDNPEVTLR